MDVPSYMLDKKNWRKKYEIFFIFHRGDPYDFSKKISQKIFLKNQKGPPYEKWKKFEFFFFNFFYPTCSLGRNCKNLPPPLQIKRHNQFLKTKPSSQDNLHFKNEIQQVIDPHRMIKLSSSQMKNGRKQMPSSWQLDFVYCLFLLCFAWSLLS